jgi:cobalt-zinc-cadmium efflux system protein
MHNHHEHHGNSHHYTRQHYGQIFAIGIVLNLSFVVIEAFYGWYAHSLALLADAGHNLSDVLGLLLAWSAVWLAQRKSSEKYTYGWRKASILAALANSIILLVAMGVMAWEAVQRFQQPYIVQSTTLIIVASCGVVINGLTAWLFMRDSKNDINIRGAFIHMLADAFVSVGVIVTGILYAIYQWPWLDPVVSLIIAIVIIISTWRLLLQSLSLSVDGVPEHIDVAEVRLFLLQQPHVKQVYNLHIWALSSSESALTAHLEMQQLPSDDSLLQYISHKLEQDFDIRHSTLQLIQHPPKNLCY